MRASFLKNIVMDRDQLVDDLKEIIKPYTENLDALENISEKTDLMMDLKINSANLVDIILDIEEKFDIVIDNDSMTRMVNIKETMAVINEKLVKDVG